MTEASNTPTTEPSDSADELRTLALVDRVIGLEAEVARLSIAAGALATDRAEVDSLRGEIERLNSVVGALYASRTWRAGSAALVPLRAARVIRSRLVGR